MGVGAVLTELREMGNVERPMCNGLRVREMTSSRSASAPSVVARIVYAYLPGAREGSEYPVGVSCPCLLYFGSRPDQHSTVRQWKSRPLSPLGVSIERVLTTKPNHTNSFGSLNNRTRGLTAFRFRETVGSIPSGGSPETSQILDGKEVK